MGNLVLPTQMSPCLRIFIASLLDESTPNGTNEIQRLSLAIAISADSDSPRHEDKAFVQKLVARVFDGRDNALDGRDSRPGRALTNAVGGDITKGK